MLPFDCSQRPALLKYDDQSIILLQEHNYCKFNIYKYYLESKIERIIWIGYYKNNDNNQCLMKKLPKDLILCILELLGKQLVMKPYIKIDV